MKETKIQIPADCEVDKIETQEGFVVVTYKKKERKLPKSWKEFCDMFPNKEGEFLLSDNSDIYEYTKSVERDYKCDKNLLPDRATAEAVLALCQLIQLRNCYNGDWVPDWKDDDMTKYVLDFRKGYLEATDYIGAMSPLYFKSEELRDEFLRNFLPLTEKLKPLYGIREGGEK